MKKALKNIISFIIFILTCHPIPDDCAEIVNFGGQGR